MKTRMEKYYNNEEGQRTHKNEEIYNKVNQSEIEQFDLNSNVSVIGESKKNIDVEALKDILDKKYNHAPQRKSIVLEEDNYDAEEEFIDENKDYDINKVLEKARSQKRVDYDEERLKRGSNIDFDDLEIDEEETDTEKEDDQLMTLINTIANNELKPIDPLDLLSDLKGEEDTIIVEGTKIEEYGKNDTKTLQSLDNLKEKLEEKEELIKEEPEINKNNLNKFDDSFYTSSMKIAKKDLADDNNDIESSTKGIKILITILSVTAIIILIIGIILLLNSIFDWNLLDYFRK